MRDSTSVAAALTGRTPTSPRGPTQAYQVAAPACAVCVGGPLTRAGRPEMSSQTGHHHRGPDPAAVVASAATGTKCPPAHFREFRPSVERMLSQGRRNIVAANGGNKGTEMPLRADHLIAPEASETISQGGADAQTLMSRQAQPARSCPPSSSQRSTSLARSRAPSSSERSTSSRSATSASVKSSGTCSVMLYPVSNLFRVNRNIPLRPDGRRVSLPTMRNNWAHRLTGWLRNQSAAAAAGFAPSSSTRWFIWMRSRVLSWAVMVLIRRTSVDP